MGAAPGPAARERLLDATRDAFTSGTSVGLRVGAAPLLVATAVVAFQQPRQQRQDSGASRWRDGL